MTDRKRSPLPTGYQFGDAKPKRALSPVSDLVFSLYDVGRILNDMFESGPGRVVLFRAFEREAMKRWRPQHENAAEQLKRRGEYNVIEGEHE